MSRNYGLLLNIKIGEIFQVAVDFFAVLYTYCFNIDSSRVIFISFNYEIIGSFNKLNIAKKVNLFPCPDRCPALRFIATLHLVEFIIKEEW